MRGCIGKRQHGSPGLSHHEWPFTARARSDYIVKIGDVSRYGKRVSVTAALKRFQHAEDVRQLFRYRRRIACGRRTAMQDEGQRAADAVTSNAQAADQIKFRIFVD